MKKLTLVSFFALLATACGGSDSSTPDARVVVETDAATIDAPADVCFSGTPTTHNELINACVDQSVTRIIKHPNLPLLNPNGTLPALP